MESVTFISLSIKNKNLNDVSSLFDRCVCAVLEKLTFDFKVSKNVNKKMVLSVWFEKNLLFNFMLKKFSFCLC